MNREKSCGAVVFTRRNGKPEFLILREVGGRYSLPKGHVEGCETEIETARREIFEETGLRPAFLEGFRREEEYDLAEKPGTRKTVVYFLAEYGNGPVTPRPGEITDARLLPCGQAAALLRHEGTRRILREAYEFLTGEHNEEESI